MPARLELGDGGVEVVDRHAVVVAGGVDRRAPRRRGDHVQLLVADRVPVPADAGDVGPRHVAEPEQTAVEGDHVVERRVVAVDGHVVEPGHLHPGSASSCSMNSRRMPPGAATNAIRRRPNGPSTISGPHSTSWPASSASRSSVNSAGCRKPSGGQRDHVLVDRAREQRDRPPAPGARRHARRRSTRCGRGSQRRRARRTRTRRRDRPPSPPGWPSRSPSPAQRTDQRRRSAATVERWRAGPGDDR